MLRDQDLRWAYDDTIEVWAPLHAWRALGQLRAEESIEPLIGLLHEIDDDSLNGFLISYLSDLMAVEVAKWCSC